MSLIDILVLSGIMVALAAMPSSSVALVVTRAVTHGLADGIAVAAGIVLGDLVFVLLAICGLSIIVEALGGVFVAIKYIGAAYLIWLGLNLLKSSFDPSPPVMDIKSKGNLLASFLAGFALTLGDVKAVFFYLSLFPIVVDLAHLTRMDIFTIVVVTTIAVGGTKVAYALFAQRVFSRLLNPKLDRSAKRAAGGSLLALGTYVLVKP